MLAVSKTFQGKSPYTAAETASGSEEAGAIITKTNFSTFIMNHLLSEAKQCGFSQVGLLVNPQNQKAIALYKQHGFCIIDGTDRFDNLRMLARVV